MTDGLPAWCVFPGLVLVGYLAGSIPFGFLTGKIKGIDLREHGSKNIGATNAGRVLGKKYFFLILLLDAGKGFLPTLAAGRLLGNTGLSPAVRHLMWLGVAFSAIAGHNWPLWLKFKGGKGVATSLGVVLAIYPFYTYPAILALMIWGFVVKCTGYVSAGSIVAALGFLAAYLLLLAMLPAWTIREQWPLITFASGMTAVLIFRHWSNIQRLRMGTEHKFLSEQDPTRQSS